MTKSLIRITGRPIALTVRMPGMIEMERRDQTYHLQLSMAGKPAPQPYSATGGRHP